MKLKPFWLIALAAVLGLAFGATAILPFAFKRDTPPRQVEVPVPDASERTAETGYSPDEIFRRAFWRHPSPSDRIVHAERRENADSDDSVKSWQWYLQIVPGSELVAVLRDPATFGLVPTTAPRFPEDRGSAPAWFAPEGELEILQSPTGGLLIFYNETQNTLFATDAGGGFAPPASSSSRKRS